jgi:hypothetical protein
MRSTKVLASVWSAKRRSLSAESTENEPKIDIDIPDYHVHLY